MYNKPVCFISAAIAVIILTGCQNHMRRTYPPYQPEPVDLTTAAASKADRERVVLPPAPSVAIYEFGVSVGKVIHAAVREPQQYASKICTLHLRFSPDGTILNLSTQGDAAFCQALQDATHQANIPKPAAGELDKNGFIPPIDFKEISPHVTVVNNGEPEEVFKHPDVFK